MSALMHYLSDLPSGTGVLAGSSALSTAAVVSQVPVPSGIPPEVAWVVPIISTALTLLVGKVLMVLAAKKSASAAIKKEQARRLREDGNPANDDRAAALEIEAAEDHAEAEALRK